MGVLRADECRPRQVSESEEKGCEKVEDIDRGGRYTHLKCGSAPKRRAAESKTKMGWAAVRKAKKAKLEDVELERRLVNLIEETGHCMRSVSSSLENLHAQESKDSKIALLEKMIAFYKRQGLHDRVDDLEMHYEGLLDAVVAGMSTSVATPSEPSSALQTSDVNASSFNGAEAGCADDALGD